MLITKQYLYQQRCAKALSSFIETKNKIYRTHGIELYIAKSKNKMVSHVRRWGSLINFENQNTSDPGQLDEYVRQYIEDL